MENKIKSVEAYVNAFPDEIKIKLNTIRALIKKLIPEIEEVMSYNMPAFKTNKVLVYFAVNKNHLGFYPTPSAVTNFQEKLVGYKTSKGAIQIPFDVELPIKLIEEIVLFRQQEELDHLKESSDEIY